MKTGVIISGSLHLLFLLFLIFDPFAFRPDPSEAVAVTEVTLLSTAEFDAALSSVPDVPVMDMAVMQMPQAEENDASAPTPDTAPDETEMDVTEAPSARDSDPDLSALERLARPEMAVVIPQPFVPDAAPQIAPVVGNGTAGSAPNASLSAPPTPRAAPRIADTAAPALPDVSRTSDRVVEAATPDAAAETVQQEADAQAPPEAVSEIVPEAQPDVAPSAAPPRAAVPPRRTSRSVANAEEIARQLRDEEEAEIRALLETAASAEAVETPPAATQQATAQLSGAQARSIGVAIAENWNKSIVLGKENYETLVVKVSVSVGFDGTIMGGVKPVEPANPTGDFAVAYEAARRAVLRAGTIPLPPGQYPEGVTLILRFDPVLGIGLN